MHPPKMDGVEDKEQPKFKTAENCTRRAVFEGNNDWLIVTLEPAANEHDEEEVHEIYDGILEDFATNMAGDIEAGNFGAVQTDDPGKTQQCCMQYPRSMTRRLNMLLHQ